MGRLRTGMLGYVGEALLSNAVEGGFLPVIQYVTYIFSLDAGFNSCLGLEIGSQAFYRGSLSHIIQHGRP